MQDQLPIIQAAGEMLGVNYVATDNHSIGLTLVRPIQALSISFC